MNELKKINIAGKINSTFSNFAKDKVTLFFTILVIIIIIIVTLLVIYLRILNSEDMDITWHENGINMRSRENKNIAAADLPSVSMGAYSLHTWFAVDKSQYNTKQSNNYAPLISYGNLRNSKETYDSLAIGAWIDNNTNNLFIVYRTDNDNNVMNYNPNSSNFNCPNKLEIANYLLNEWNLLSIVVNGKNIMLYLNGQLYTTEIHNNLVYYDQNYPSLDIQVAQDNNINGVQKNIRFRNKVYSSKEIADLYFDGPNKFVLPDFRKTTYIKNTSTPDLFVGLGSKSTGFLDAGANAINYTLNKMDSFFKLFN